MESILVFVVGIFLALWFYIGATGFLPKILLKAGVNIEHGLGKVANWPSTWKNKYLVVGILLLGVLSQFVIESNALYTVSVSILGLYLVGLIVAWIERYDPDI